MTIPWSIADRLRPCPVVFPDRPAEPSRPGPAADHGCGAERPQRRLEMPVESVSKVVLRRKGAAVVQAVDALILELRREGRDQAADEITRERDELARAIRVVVEGDCG